MTERKLIGFLNIPTIPKLYAELMDEQKKDNPQACITVEKIDHYFNNKLSHTLGNIPDNEKSDSKTWIPDKEEKLPELIEEPLTLISSNLNKGYNNKFNMNSKLASQTCEFTDILTNKLSYDYKKNEIQFVSFRNNLNKIMKVLFTSKKKNQQKYNEFKVKIINKDNIIYFEIVNENNNETIDQITNKNIYWGNKFEELSRVFLCKNDDDKQKFIIKKEGKIYKNTEYCIMNKVKIWGHTLILSAEIDCINKNEKLVEVKTSNYKEMKTQNLGYKHKRDIKNEIKKEEKNKNDNDIERERERENQKEEIKEEKLDKKGEIYIKNHGLKLICNNNINKYSFIFPDKALKWWIQCKLGNIDDILVGWKLKNGIIKGITQCKLDDIYTISRNVIDKKFLVENRCKHNVIEQLSGYFTSKILSLIKRLCKENNGIYQLEFSFPFHRLNLFKLIN